MTLIRNVVVLLFVSTLATGVFVWLGIYNVAADDPHWSTTYRVMETLVKRSIETRASRIEVPMLNDDELVRRGAGNYNSMCVGCHLAPGAADTELSLGLYPAPPTWSELGAADPRDAFWVIKHGVKMSGMPAWGKSMEDRYIWEMVALLQRFPHMTASQYKALVAESPGHNHGGGETEISASKPDHTGGHQSEDVGSSSFEPADDPMAGDPKDADVKPHRDDGHSH